jgi:hypothetical protein
MRYRHILLSMMIGGLSGFLCMLILQLTNNSAGDFGWSLRAARDLWYGHDPYAYPIAPDLVSYPLPAAIFAFPFAILPNEAAAGLFFGLSSGLLAWCLLHFNHQWALLLFLSWPFVYGLLFAQWPPLLLCLWFLPPFLPVVLIKPHIALPLALTTPISRTGILLSGFLLLGSLALYPSWPWVWVHQIQTYQGTRPPLLVFPFGPLLLLALLRWHDRRAWLLVIMAIMPQRVVYDQLALLLIATTRRELVTLVVCSWLSLPVLVVAGGWPRMPGGWQLWILLTLYLPALIILLRIQIETFIRQSINRFSHKDVLSS